jgi:predicted transposase/invertase (TIGR01784 family)
MRRDSIFYQLFRQSPTLLFSLISEPPEDAESYVFEAVEVKETAFRLDGIFLPPSPMGIVYFCEVQFQLDEMLYERILTEIAIYVYRNRDRLADWRGLVIYPSRSMEQSNTATVVEMLASGRIQRVYLDELGEMEELPMGVGLMVLTTLEGDEAKSQARRAIERSGRDRAIIDLVSTIMVYKFNNLSRDEVDAMLGIELEQTRVYRDAKAEGKAEGELIGEARGEARGKAEGTLEGETRMVMRLLNRRLGKKVPAQYLTQIQQLTVMQLEDLGEALLDFTTVADLESWLLTVDR